MADEHVPQGLVTVMRSARIDVRTAREMGCRRLQDDDLFARARVLRRVILTLDAGFWSERKFPVHNGGGIVFIDTAAKSVPAYAMAFGFFHAAFGKSFGGVWEDGGRVRALVDRFFLRIRSLAGLPVTYEVKAVRGVLCAREMAQPRG